MKRLIFVLSSIFYALPVHAIGFWGSATGGFLKGGYNDLCSTYQDSTYCVSDRVSFSSDITAFGGSLEGGVSLQPLTPIVLGLGLDMFQGKNFIHIKFWGQELKDSTKVSRLYTKLVLGYQFGITSLKIRLGLYPAFAIYIYKNYNTDSTYKASGFAFGGFGDAYYFTGPVGFGGGIFVDYSPSLKYEDKSTFKNMINLGVRLGLAFSLGVLE